MTESDFSPEPIALAAFVAALPPDPDVEVPDEAFLTYAEGLVPHELVQLWRTHGLGFYGQQRLAIVDPGVWLPALQAWFGSGVTSVPIAVSSFGHLYHVLPDGTVECLDPHFQVNAVVAPDVVTFFNDHLPGPTSHLADLAGPRDGARAKLGPLVAGETYYFTPALVDGGQVSPESLDKGDGVAQLIAIHASAARQRA